MAVAQFGGSALCWMRANGCFSSPSAVLSQWDATPKLSVSYRTPFPWWRKYVVETASATGAIQKTAEAAVDYWDESWRRFPPELQDRGNDSRSC